MLVVFLEMIFISRHRVHLRWQNNIFEFSQHVITDFIRMINRTRITFFPKTYGKVKVKYRGVFSFFIRSFVVYSCKFFGNSKRDQTRRQSCSEISVTVYCKHRTGKLVQRKMGFPVNFQFLLGECTKNTYGDIDTGSEGGNCKYESEIERLRISFIRDKIQVNTQFCMVILLLIMWFFSKYLKICYRRAKRFRPSIYRVGRSDFLFFFKKSYH